MISSSPVRNRVLFYHTGGIGDFITVLPTVKALRRIFSSSEFVLQGRPSIGSLGHNRFYFDQMLNADRAVWAGLFSRFPVASEVRNLFETVERAFLWTASEILPVRIKELGVPFVHWQAPFPLSVRHVIDYHLDLVQDLFEVDSEIAPVLYPTEEDRKKASTLFPSGSVMLHPGSGSLAKNWPLSLFREVAMVLAREGQNVVWIVGPAEEERGLRKDLPGQIFSCADLPVLAAALESCRLFIGNDSGISHLAAAVSAPTVAIFGHTDPQIWAPRGETVRIVGGLGRKMDEIAIDEVLLAAREII